MVNLAALAEAGAGLGLASTAPSSAVSALAREIDQRGYAEIQAYLPGVELAAARAFCAQALERSAGYACFVGAREMSGALPAQGAGDPRLSALCAALYASKLGRAPPSDECHQVLRCLGPQADARHSLLFHFDSFVVTALIPVAMPDEGGDLLLLPNMRSVRGSYFANLIDKAVADNPLTQAGLRALYRLAPDAFVRLKLVPGNLYLFWGYCSLHTNEPCPPGAMRATALFHFADPHLDDPLKRRLGRGVRPE